MIVPMRSKECRECFDDGVTAAVDCVLEILDAYYLWHYEESSRTYITVGKEIEDKIKALKGGERE